MMWDDEKSARRFRPRPAGLVALALALLIAPGVAAAADHRDGPRFNGSGPDIRVFGNLDLNDLYIFPSPVHRDNTVLILTTGGTGVGFVTPAFFCPGCLYEFRIDNTGDNVDDLTIGFVFSNPDRFHRQNYRAFLTDRRGRSTLLAQGTTGRNAPIRGGGAATAGLFDDPFFFDATAFAIFNRLVAAGAPLGERVAPFTGTPFPTSNERDIRTPRPPNNFFANTNVLAIVLDIPRIRLQSNARNTRISVWGRDTLPDGVTQFDRVAIPAVATTIVPPGAMQDQFNSATPRDDVAFRPAVAQRIQLAYGADAATAEAIAATVLPDRLPFRTTSRDGFNDGLTLKLNGRRLSDDVVDAELKLLTGGALTSDRVVNDSVFRKTFPYMGPALPLKAAARRDQSGGR